MDNFELEVTKVDKIIEEAKKKKAKLRVICDHCKKNGKLNLDPVAKERGLFICNKCGEPMHLDKLSQQEIQTAIGVASDMINQIKCFADAETDAKIIASVGEVLYNLKQTVELYDKIVIQAGNNNKKKKKKNKHKNDSDNYGSYGTSGLNSFSAGRKSNW